MHLGDMLASLSTARQLDVLEAEVVETVVGQTLLAILAGNLLELLGIVAVENPLLAHSWQALLQIYLIVRVAVRTAGIVDVTGAFGSVCGMPRSSFTTVGVRFTLVIPTLICGKSFPCIYAFSLWA